MSVGVAYHYIRPDFKQKYPGIFGLTTEQFQKQLEVLAGMGEFISQADMRRAVQTGFSLPERSWLITIDDGLLEHYEHALPVLERLGIPAIFFASTMPLAENKLLHVHMVHVLRSNVSAESLSTYIYELIEAKKINNSVKFTDEQALNQYRYDDLNNAKVKYLLNFVIPQDYREKIIEACFKHFLDFDERDVVASLYMNHGHLKELAQRDFLGTHSHEHKPLGMLQDQQITNDIQISLEHLENWTGKRLDSIAFPYGSLEACPVCLGEIMSDLDISMGYTMERASLEKDCLPIFFPRFAPNDIPGGTSEKWPGKDIFTIAPKTNWYKEHL